MMHYQPFCVQMTQRKVETTLKDMMEQKSKLAYDNGKLQSQVTQLSQDLAAAQAQCSDTAQLRKVTEMAQAKVIQVSVSHGTLCVRMRACACVCVCVCVSVVCVCVCVYPVQWYKSSVKVNEVDSAKSMHVVVTNNNNNNDK